MGRQGVSLLQAGLPDFLLVPPEADGAGSPAEEEVSELRLLPRPPGALPPVWQDFLDCLSRANSSDYIAQLACSGGRASEGTAQGEVLDPLTVFKLHLSPEALVRRHRLGQPEIKRVYQALQVYSLGFHQTIVEATTHALDKGDLLVAIWRAFAMLWDGALQAVFASETVKLSKERQAAAMSAEATRVQLQASEAAREEVAVENAALRGRMEGMVVEMLSVRADASVLGQAAGAAEAEARRLQREAHQLSQQLAARTTEAAELRAQLQKLTSVAPGEQAAKLERAERLLAEKAEALAAGAKREAAASQEKEAAQNLARAERLKREEAQARAQQLQVQVDDLGLKLRALQSQHSAAMQAGSNQQLLEDRLAVLGDADTKLDAWRARAEEAEARVAALEKEVEGERARNEELVDSFWPLAAKLKALEAQQGGG